MKKKLTIFSLVGILIVSVLAAASVAAYMSEYNWHFPSSLEKVERIPKSAWHVYSPLITFDFSDRWYWKADSQNLIRTRSVECYPRKTNLLAEAFGYSEDEGAIFYSTESEYLEYAAIDGGLWALSRHTCTSGGYEMNKYMRVLLYEEGQRRELWE